MKRIASLLIVSCSLLGALEPQQEEEDLLALPSNELMPLFQYMRLPDYPFHHPSFALEAEHEGEEEYDPGFDPYGSFIFEDNVYYLER